MKNYKLHTEKTFRDKLRLAFNDFFDGDEKVNINEPYVEIFTTYNNNGLAEANYEIFFNVVDFKESSRKLPKVDYIVELLKNNPKSWCHDKYSIFVARNSIKMDYLSWKEILPHISKKDYEVSTDSKKFGL